ncbi:MAG: hypothetical protein PHC50_03495 [Candidatus Cloacimonetes bacterium]|nr:hypothetical protein [Candidatus Cloacimonadota bacterium]
MSIFKKRSRISIQITGCKDCPLRTSKVVFINDNDNFKSLKVVQVCRAIIEKTHNGLFRKPTIHHLYPCVADALKGGSYLPECPLPDAKGVAR